MQKIPSAGENISLFASDGGIAGQVVYVHKLNQPDSPENVAQIVVESLGELFLFTMNFYEGQVTFWSIDGTPYFE